jgi:anaerobic selenocysteine-containing dehydrogenase
MSKEISRRDFLKGSTAVGAGMLFLRPSGGIGDIFKAPRWTRDGKIHAQNITVGAEWRPSVCTMCSNTCGIQYAVKKVGGVERAVKIEGNPYHPYNLGKVCARGQSGVLRTYHPDRIRKPLIRVEGSKRGMWKFREASWDEAYDYIAKKMKEKGIQPYEIVVAGGWITCAMYRPPVIAFALSLGSPNILGTPLQHCVSSEHLGLDALTGNFNVHDETISDYENADVILALRSNASVSGIATGRAVRFSKALAKGAKVIVLDPRLSELGAKATKWVPIKPGTDPAFLLAMLRETIYGKHYDAEYTRSFTNAPFLAYSMNGMVMPAMKMDKKTGRPTLFYVYDEKSKKIVGVPAGMGTNLKDVDGNDIQPALEVPADLKLGDKPVTTVFQALKESVKDYTIDWAAKITDISAGTIKEIFDTFFSAKRPLIEPGWYGARYANTVQMRKTQAIIMALMGRIDTEGGWNFAGGYRESVVKFWETIKAGKKPSSAPGLMAPMMMKQMFFDNPKAFPHKHPSINHAWSESRFKEGKLGVAYTLFGDMGFYEAATGKLQYDGKPYRFRALFSFAANVMRSFGDEKKYKEIFDKLDLVVVSDIAPMDITLYADVILPDLTYLEKADFVFEAGMSPDTAVVARNPVEKVPGIDSRHMVRQMWEIAEKLGQGERFWGTLSSFMGWDMKAVQEELGKFASGQTKRFGEALLNVSVRAIAEETKISEEKVREELMTKGVLTFKTAKENLEEARIPEKYPAPTPSGRLEIYSLLFADFVQKYGPNPLWNPLVAYVPPQWKEGMKDTDKLSGNEFFFAHGKTPLMSYTSTANNPLLISMAETMPDERFGLWINASKAKELGIRNGDTVKVINTLDESYSVEMKAYVTEKIRPDTVFMLAPFGMENAKLSFGFNKGVPLNRLVPLRHDAVAGGFRANEFTVRVEKVL